MDVITGARGSGKTTKLILYARDNGCVLVVPTYRMMKYAYQQALHLHCDDVPIITIDEMLQSSSGEHKFVIDELDICLKKLNVVAYTNTNGN